MHMKKYEAPIRRKVLTGVVVLAGAVTLVFGIDALREGLIQLAAVDLSVSAFSVGIMLAMRKRPGSMIPNWAFTVIMTSFFVYLFASGGHGGTGLLFMLLIPLATPLFLGWKAGAAVSLGGLAACGGVAIWGSVASPFQGIPEGALLARLAAIYIVSLIISCLYDSGMQRAYGEESRAKEALQESEERYRSLFNSSLQCVYVLDFEGNFLDANEAALKLLGYDRAEITDLNFASLINEDQLPTALAVLQEVVETGTQEHDSEYRLRCRDGSFVEVNTTAALVYREGKPYAIQGVARDITERRRAEEALRQSEERYRTILEETGDGYFECDLKGNFTFVNDAEARLLGYSKEEIIGTSYKVLVPEDTAGDIFKAYNRIYRTGEPVRDFLSEVIRRDGSHGFGETSAFPIRNENGEIVGFRGVRRDVTDRRRAEQALRESEERYRTLFDRTANPILVIDTEGNYVDANEAGLAFLECTRKELVTKNVEDFSGLGSDEQLLKQHMRLWVEGGRIDVEHHVNGGVKVLDLTITPVTRQGQAVVIGVGTDITERRKAEEELRVQHAYFQQLFDGSPDAILMLDTDDRVQEVNEGFEKLFGYTPAEAIGRPINELVAAEDNVSQAVSLSREVLLGRVVRSDVVRRRKDGSPVSVSVVGYPIRFNDEVVGIYVMYFDITRRKEAEDALRRSEEKHRTILEEMEDSYFEVDLGGHITFANDSSCRDLGYSREELIGMSYKQFTLEEDVESVFRMFNEVYLAGTPNRGFSWRTARRDGSIGFAETSVSPLRDNSGEIVGFSGVGRDVTERKRAEEALRVQTAYFQQLFDSSPDAVVMLDTDDRVTRVNRGFEELFGYGTREVEGRSLNDSIIPENHLEESSSSSRTVLQGGIVRKEAVRRRKDGSPVDVAVLGYPIHLDGKTVGMYVTYTDITERKKQAEQLMMADRLASVGELAAGAAHELNNPLTSVMGFSQLLMESDIPEEIRKDLEIIYSEARRASEVTKNLLTFARKHTPVKQPNQINSIIEDVLKLRAYEHTVSNIKVKTQLSRSLPEIKGDYFQMQQILLNIIVNAEQVMVEANRGGTLTVATRERNGTVIVSISDDGPGIAPEHLGHIFNPFFTTKEPGKGTGLGLSICYGMVNEHGGRIYAKSGVGKGATFFVELPVNGVE